VAEHTAFPARWSDGLCRALPGAEFLLASLALRKLPAPRRLAPMPHPQDLTVATTARTTRFCRTQADPASPKGLGRTRRRSSDAACEVLTRLGSIHCPALPLTSATAPPTSTAARSAARDDVRPPLFAGSGSAIHTSNPNFGKAEYFAARWLTKAWLFASRPVQFLVGRVIPRGGCGPWSPSDPASGRVHRGRGAECRWCSRARSGSASPAACSRPSGEPRHAVCGT
jgi:hypothetical protein